MVKYTSPKWQLGWIARNAFSSFLLANLVVRTEVYIKNKTKP